jgi:hypothetical protein
MIRHFISDFLDTLQAFQRRHLPTGLHFLTGFFSVAFLVLLQRFHEWVHGMVQHQILDGQILHQRGAWTMELCFRTLTAFSDLQFVFHGIRSSHSFILFEAFQSDFLSPIAVMFFERPLFWISFRVCPSEKVSNWSSLIIRLKRCNYSFCF